jgi:ribosomal protein S12 methylthiotransferase accessory factor
MASGESIHIALHCALFELIERDAFMRHWMAQRGGREILKHSLPRQLQNRIATLEQAGCRISIQRLPTNLAYVALVIIQHEKHHFTCLGSAAKLNPEGAVEHAMREAEVMAYSRLETPRAPRIHPKRVRKPEDHSNLYAQPEYFRKGDRLFLTDGQTKLPKTPPKLLPKSADNLVARLRGRFGRVFCVDMTIPGVHEKFGNLKTVRAIVPGLIPLTFGYGHLPLGMVRRYHPGCLFPHPFA